MKKFITLALALCMALSASICASAAEIDTDGGSGSTPVYLSSTEDGTMEGDPSATAMSVTVPTALPMAMSQTGDVATADNCQIINNSYGAVNVTVPASLPVHVINGTVVTADNAVIKNNSKMSSVQVTSISVTDGAYKVGDYDDFSGSNTIALKINDCVTKGSGKMTINTKSFPVIRTGGSQALTYFAKVSGDAPNVEDVQAANVVFTISIAD